MKLKPNVSWKIDNPKKYKRRVMLSTANDEKKKINIELSGRNLKTVE